MRSKADGLADVSWFKSSYSNDQGGACVEGARLDDGSLALRDSKHPHGPACIFPNATWAAFTAAVKAGQFGRTIL
jgi:hypothetical protein